MSVVYDIIYKDNSRIPMSGPCFGGFAYDGRRVSFPSHQLRSSVMTRLGTDRTGMRNLFENPSDARFFQFHCEPNRNFWPEEGKYYDEMKALFADIPWLKASVHPLVKVIRVPLMNAPADKVMMTLFLARNLAHYEYATAYQTLRERFHFKPFAAAIMSSFWKQGRGTALAAGTFFYTQCGEYNWLNPYTFGINSLERLVQAGNDFNPWFQDNWSDQGGYKRDGWFSDEGIEFNSQEGVARHNNSSHYRKLIDCLSVQHDTPIWDVVQTSFGGHHYWNVLTDQGQTRHFTTDQFTPLVVEFITKCRGFGYDPIVEQ